MLGLEFRLPETYFMSQAVSMKRCFVFVHREGILFPEALWSDYYFYMEIMKS